MNHWTALKRAKQAVAQRPCVQTWSDLSACQTRLNQPRQALESAQRALALDPQSTIAHFNLGVAQLKLGQLAEAARSFEWAGPLGEGNLAVTAALRGDLALAHRLGDDYSHVSGFLAQMDRPLHRTLVQVQCRFSALWLRRPWAVYLPVGLWAVALNQVQGKFAYGFTLLLPLILASPLFFGHVSQGLQWKGLRGRIPLMLALGAAAGLIYWWLAGAGSVYPVVLCLLLIPMICTWVEVGNRLLGLLALGQAALVVAYVGLRDFWLVDRAQLLHLFDFGLFYWIFWLVCGSLMRRPSSQVSLEDLLAKSQSRTLFEA